MHRVKKLLYEDQLVPYVYFYNLKNLMLDKLRIFTTGLSLLYLFYHLSKKAEKQAQRGGGFKAILDEDAKEFKSHTHSSINKDSE